MIFISADKDKKKSKDVSLIVPPVVFTKMQILFSALIPDRICGDIIFPFLSAGEHLGLPAEHLLHCDQ